MCYQMEQYAKPMNTKEAHWILRFVLWGMRYVQEIAINMRREWKHGTEGGGKQNERDM